MPYATIGRAVGLSEAAVRHRVQRLIDAGVMQVVAVTNPLQVGFPRAAMIGITVEGDLEAVASQVEALPEVDYLVICAGGFALMAKSGDVVRATLRPDLRHWRRLPEAILLHDAAESGDSPCARSVALKEVMPLL